MMALASTTDSVRADSMVMPASSCTSSPHGGGVLVDGWHADSLYPRHVERQDTLSLASECHIPHQGMRLPYRHWNDDAITGILVVCMVLMFTLLSRNWKMLRQQAKAFFMPPRERGALSHEEVESDQYLVLVMSVILCTMGSLLMYQYVVMQNPVMLAGRSPMWLLGAYFLCSLAYFAVRYMAARYVNWIFFDRVKKLNWESGFSFVVCAENILFFPIILVVLYADVPVRIVYFLLLILLVICKILWLIREFRIFFGNLYGLLHLFVYFCALEVMPLLALLRVLIYITESLIV